MRPEGIAISKSVMPCLPAGYEETLLGARDGAIRQYRGKSGIHVREYEDRFVFHKDKLDPRKNPLGHLVLDSPETLLALGSAFLLSWKSAKTRDAAKQVHLLANPLFFLFTFFSLNSIFRTLKRLILG